MSIGLATPAQAATTSYTFEQLVDTVPVTPPLYVGYRGPTQFIPATKMTGGTWVTALGGAIGSYEVWSEFWSEFWSEGNISRYWSGTQQ